MSFWNYFEKVPFEVIWGHRRSMISAKFCPPREWFHINFIKKNFYEIEKGIQLKTCMNFRWSSCGFPWMSFNFVFLYFAILKLIWRFLGLLYSFFVTLIQEISGFLAFLAFFVFNYSNSFTIFQFFRFNFFSSKLILYF